MLRENATSSIDDFNNEMDVIFMYKNKFYYIECKTSIIAFKHINQKNGISKEKEYNILGETIYKSDSLKNRFGLYSKTFIITLTDFKKYCFDKDNGQQNNKNRAMEEVINRTNLSQIKLIDKSMLVNTTQISVYLFNRYANQSLKSSRFKLEFRTNEIGFKVWEYYRYTLPYY